MPNMIADTTRTDAEAEVMARYGITCVTVPHYHYKTWRYAKLSDAIAQAKRDEAAAGAAS
jgi:hypothetical protein